MARRLAEVEAAVEAAQTEVEAGPRAPAGPARKRHPQTSSELDIPTSKKQRAAPAAGPGPPRHGAKHAAVQDAAGAGLGSRLGGAGGADHHGVAGLKRRVVAGFKPPRWSE